MLSETSEESAVSTWAGFHPVLRMGLEQIEKIGGAIPSEGKCKLNARVGEMVTACRVQKGVGRRTEQTQITTIKLKQQLYDGNAECVTMGNTFYLSMKACNSITIEVCVMAIIQKNRLSGALTCLPCPISWPVL